jgi:hypothetical protein
MYLSFWGAIDTFVRDLKGERTRLECPRLNLCLLTHPKTFAKTLKGKFAKFFKNHFIICI